MAARIIGRDHFKNDQLVGLLARVQQAPNEPLIQLPSFSRAIALIALHSGEETIQRGASEHGHREIELARTHLRRSLSISPSDSFLWFALYSFGVLYNGLDPTEVAYLNQSYETGPYEGWISTRRNRLAVAAFPFLPSSLQTGVVAEFGAMVNSGFIEDAALVIATVGRTFSDRLVDSLKQVDPISREELVKRLAKDGVQLKIPGVEIEDRPWR